MILPGPARLRLRRPAGGKPPSWRALLRAAALGAVIAGAAGAVVLLVLAVID